MMNRRPVYNFNPTAPHRAARYGCPDHAHYALAVAYNSFVDNSLSVGALQALFARRTDYTLKMAKDALYRRRTMRRAIRFDNRPENLLGYSEL